MASQHSTHSSSSQNDNTKLFFVFSVALLYLGTLAEVRAQTCNSPAATLTRADPIAANSSFCGGDIAEAAACFGSGVGVDKLAVGLTLEGTDGVDLTCTATGDTSLCIMSPDCGTVLVAEGTGSARLVGNVPSTELKLIIVANSEVNQICSEEPTITCNGPSWGQSHQGGVVQFVDMRSTVDEGAQVAEVRVQRTDGGSGAISVNYRTSEGTATAGQDYQEVQGTFQWADGDLGQRSVLVQIVDDATAEGGETLTLSLSSPAGDAAAGPRREAELLIVDNDTSAGSFQDEDFPGFRFRVTISTGNGQPPKPAVVVTAGCPKETVCIAGAIPDRIEMFLRIVGPKPNGFLQTNIVRFSTSQLDVEITQLGTGITKAYSLPIARAGGSNDLDGLIDREAFLP